MAPPPAFRPKGSGFFVPRLPLWHPTADSDRDGEDAAAGRIYGSGAQLYVANALKAPVSLIREFIHRANSK